MASILIASGFKNLESLKEFSLQFPNVACPLDKELDKIWICHKTLEEIPKFEDLNLLPNEGYPSLLKKVKKKINASKDFLSLMTEFSPLFIFDKIYDQFKAQLSTYIFSKCYLFYNWGMNAFEPVFDHFEIHKQIEKSQKNSILNNVKMQQVKKLQNNPNCLCQSSCKFCEPGESSNRTEEREKSVDLFEEPENSRGRLKSRVSFKAVKTAIQNAERFYDIPRNSNNAYQETFNLDKILYDMKQKSRWPQNHVLCSGSVEDLMAFIIQMPLATNVCTKEKLLNDHKNWLILRNLLGKFLEQHKNISKYNGYGRILKKHLKKGLEDSHLIDYQAATGAVRQKVFPLIGRPPGRRLVPIPKPVVCTYVVDILRRVLPLELFGTNRLRKDFIKGLMKVIKGAKQENFIWYPLLRSLLKNESKLAWCSELGDHYTRSQMMLKLFKFLVIDYVFILLKNNFYITETGSSGFGLRFYRKSDMESVTSTCVNSLLKDKRVEPLSKDDDEEDTLERGWLETGRISKEGVRRKLRQLLGWKWEYRQSVAPVKFLPKSDESDELRILTTLSRKVPKELAGGKNKKLEKIFRIRLLRRKKKIFFVKLLLEFIIEKYGSGVRAEPSNAVLSAIWEKAVNLKERYGRLFYVKADITDAFGSVKYNVLSDILEGLIEEESHRCRIQMRRIIEWKKTRFKVEKAVRFSFSNRAKENSVMIHRSVRLRRKKESHLYYDPKFLEIIKQVMMMQRIRIKGKIFRLLRGLAMGGAGLFSSELNEIYYSSMDRRCFMRLVNPRDTVFLRAVDDYLFITPNEKRAKDILDLVQGGIDYHDVRFNSSKLKSNLIEDSQQVSYLGLVFDFEDMSVKPNYNKYLRSGVLATTKLSDPWGNAHFNKNAFLQRKCLLINCLKLHSIVLKSGNLKKTRQTIFEACIVQSLRVITLADYLYTGCVKNDLTVYKVLVKSCGKIKNRVSESLLPKDEVTWLFFFAAFNVVKRWSGQYKLLFMIIRFKLQKYEKGLTSIGSELFLNLLREDILCGEYWQRVGTFQREIKYNR